MLTATRTVNYGCRLVDPATGGPFGSGNAPDSAVTFVLEYPSKVGVGQTFQVRLRLDPAPKNGPIALNVGEVTYTIGMAATGATVPGLEFTGANTAAIAPNAVFSLPQDASFLVGSVTAPAQAGGDITMDMGKVDLLGDKGLKVLTACTPKPKAGESPVKLASVEVVEEQVEVPVVTTTTTTTTAPATGYASCAEARADGRGVIPRTSPAYSAALDPNGNGLACDSTDNPEATVQGVSTTRSTTTAGSALAFTGLASLKGVTAGLVLLLGGLVLVGSASLRRRRRDSES
ncbi:MAG: excalibur calcium-binding domain-containing protein [Actinomycetes bacterium]